MAKRIQMRKNRFLAIQKLAEQKQKQGMEPPGDPDHAPKPAIPPHSHTLPASHLKSSSNIVCNTFISVFKQY